MTPEEASQKITAAHEVADLLNHIGWEERVHPALLRIRKNEQDILTKMVLRASLQEQFGRTTSEVAGCIYGIDILIGTFVRILRDGMSAEDAYVAAIKS